MWFEPGWFALVQTGAIASAFIFAGVALFLNTRSRGVANVIQLTQQHRHLWERMYVDPALARILDPAADPTSVTLEEEMFVTFIILHLSTSYYAITAGFFQKPEGLNRDIELFFSLPIPRAVWTKVGALQDRGFVRFVESNWPEARKVKARRS